MQLLKVAKRVALPSLPDGRESEINGLMMFDLLGDRGHAQIVIIILIYVLYIVHNTIDFQLYSYLSSSQATGDAKKKGAKLFSCRSLSYQKYTNRQGEKCVDLIV